MATKPREVLFECMKAQYHLSNRDLALLILSQGRSIGGKTADERISQKTWLSREVVHAAPGVNNGWLTDPPTLGSKIAGTLRRAYPGHEGALQLIDYFAGDGAAMMRAALRETRLEDSLYANMVAMIRGDENLRDVDRAELLCSLFAITGAFGSPAMAVECVKAQMEQKLGVRPRTASADASNAAPVVEDPAGKKPNLALIRVEDGKVRSNVMRLSVDPEGTVIGSLATSPNAINDVEQDVSKNHLLIWRAADGQWLAKGLGSRFGTVLISGLDQTRHVVEPPESSRGPMYISKPVPVAPSDRLILASKTEFLVFGV